MVKFLAILHGPSAAVLKFEFMSFAREHQASGHTLWSFGMWAAVGPIAMHVMFSTHLFMVCAGVIIWMMFACVFCSSNGSSSNSIISWVKLEFF